MSKHQLTLILFLFTVTFLYSARPTVHASNFYSSNYECTKMTLNWINGNGSARVIIAREGSLPNYTPQDGEVYTPNSIFGMSLEYGNSGDGNYVVYNGNGNTSVVITGLTRGKTYYFAIYEHDNNGNSTQYLTSGAPTHSGTSYDVLLDFNITVNDSCERSNSFTFFNNSSSTVPGISYLFDFGNGTSTLGMVTHKISGNGMRPVILKAISGISNCPSQIVKTVKIFPKKIVNLDISKIKDTLQCFDGNYFEAKTTPLTAPFPMGNTYAWHTGDSLVSHFPTLRKTYQMSGRFRVMLVINMTSYMQATACFDTMYFTVAVKPDPRKNLKINSLVQKVDTNFFRFENIDTSIAWQTWYFGDGDTSVQDTCSHRYADTGKYKLRLKVMTNDGCLGEKDYMLAVFDSGKVTALHTLQLNRLNLYPNPVHHMLNIQVNDFRTGDELQILDIHGRVVDAFDLQSDSTQIDVSHLSKGLYFVRLLRDGEMMTGSLLEKD